MTHDHLDTLSTELTEVIDRIATVFGPVAQCTVDGEQDCDPANPGHLTCRNYGVRLESSPAAEQRPAETVRSMLEKTGWQAHDRTTAREMIARFSRDGADLAVHVARTEGSVAIIGSTRCLPTA
ncbi:hypothetical protein ATK36_1506 [Amycolatopsis sulphurea]|uniref:Uncharacterized protein n=1 Tax=Amycolatopsis sulphurea TaxID=76022 RepID=A0A2A9F5C5_9PSEU|nr:hypothetical protein ATK36_1506 [Amycolatopsis sulphurea]